tara:strand:+ start:5099 stop:7045 length:1947 start_codon:yes stop_codon:yes gene_type:complete
MADTRYFQSTATMPQVDYGAIYDRAVARREQREQRELDYLNSFQQVRGALTPGGKKLGQESFQLIQDSLNSGDMSVEAQRERTQLYNEYKDIMAAGLEYKNKLDDVSKRIYADPSKYNKPDELTAQIDVLRNQDFTDITDVDNAISNIPSLAQYKRYSAPVYSINDAVQDYRKGVSVDQFYNIETGELDNEGLKQSIGEYFDFQNLDDDDIYGIIASDLRSKGLLSNTAADSARILEIVGDDERAKASTVSFIEKVYNASMNSFNTDIQTAAEKKRQSDLLASRGNVFSYDLPSVTGVGNESIPLTLIPKLELIGDEKALSKDNATEEVVPVSAVGNISGTKPTYEDNKGVKRTIEKVGLDLKGNPIVVLSYDQPVEGLLGKEKHKVTEIVPWNDVSEIGWTGENQVERIKSTIEDMRSNYRPQTQPGENTTEITDETVIETPGSTTQPSAVSSIFGDMLGELPKDVDDPTNIPPSERPVEVKEEEEITMERPDITGGSDRTNVNLGPELKSASNVQENLNENEVVVEQLPEPAQEDEPKSLVERQNEEQDKMRSLSNSREYYNELVDVAEIVNELDTADLDFGDILPSSITVMTEENLQDLVSRNEIDLGKYSVKEFKDLIAEYVDNYPLFFKSALDQDGQMELVEV